MKRLLIASSLVLLLNGYVGVSLLPALPFGAFGRVFGGTYLLASCALIPLGLMSRRLRRQPLADGLAWVGLLMLGLFSSLVVLTAVRDVGMTLVALFWPGIVQRVAGGSAETVVVAAVAVTLIGFANARRSARVVEVEVPIVGLPDALRGFTIAQISDVHVGPTIKRPFLEAIVDRVNGLGADMIAVTGDLVDGSVRQLAAHTAPLARLAARHGVFFVTGNHEYYSGEAAWTAEFRRLGLRVLINEHVVIRHRGSALVVAGVTDFGAHRFDPLHRSDPRAALAGAPTDAAVNLLLAHQPRTAPAAAQAGFDLQLSGHTHGGQFWPWTFFVRYQQPFVAGLNRLGDLWVYISRGTGYWGPPKRFGAPSEITRLRLVAGPVKMRGHRAAREPCDVRPAAQGRRPSVTGGTALGCLRYSSSKETESG